MLLLNAVEIWLRNSKKSYTKVKMVAFATAADQDAYLAILRHSN
jgi:hypothetical protein